jgi:HPt (histidine-containing phosphotransfer) domain-containing protein
MGEEKLYDLTFLNKISGGDQSFIREMISTFREIAPAYMIKARHLVAENDIDALSKETHKIIPGIGFLGAKELESELMLIEEYTKKHENLPEVPALVENVGEKIERLLETFDTDFKDLR